MVQAVDITTVFSGLERRVARLENAVQSGDVRGALAILAEQFQDDLAQTAVLRAFEGDELFGEVISELALQGRAYAPISLARLYEKSCKLLLDRSTAIQGGRIDLRVRPALALSERQQRLFLESFAFELFARGVSDLTVEEIDAQWEEKIATLIHSPANLRATSVRQLFVEIGILREDTFGRVSFTSHHFQAFFAACAIGDRQEVEILVKNAHQPDWQDVVLLVVGHASRVHSGQILTALLARIDEETIHKQSLLELLACAYRVVIEVEPHLREEIERRLHDAEAESKSVGLYRRDADRLELLLLELEREHPDYRFDDESIREEVYLSPTAFGQTIPLLLGRPARYEFFALEHVPRRGQAIGELRVEGLERRFFIVYAPSREERV